MINPIKQQFPSKIDKIPEQYCQYSRVLVFSKEASHEFPPSCIWDHAIELKPGAPASLPGKLIPLFQPELTELRKFVKEHLTKGTIQPSKSLYNWTIKNKYPPLLIPQLVNQL